MIGTLFKDYRPLAFFGWLALILLVLAVAVIFVSLGTTMRQEAISPVMCAFARRTFSIT